MNAVNDAPTISTVANQTTTAGTAVGPINFTVGDVETAAASLTLGGSSNNTDVGTSCPLNFTLADDTFFLTNVGFRCCR